MVKPRLILLSDLYGKSKINWEKSYIDHFQNDFEIQYYDCCDLGEVDKTDGSQEKPHQQFVTFGIEKAVENLLKIEKETVTILAFSVGGTIAWKAALRGLKVRQLIALSATRLRYETYKPNCNIQLFYGENDQFQPQQDWFKKMKIVPQIIKNTNHEFYKAYNPESLSVD